MTDDSSVWVILAVTIYMYIIIGDLIGLCRHIQAALICDPVSQTSKFSKNDF